jgi:hypothetical protein
MNRQDNWILLQRNVDFQPHVSRSPPIWWE